MRLGCIGDIFFSNKLWTSTFLTALVSLSALATFRITGSSSPPCCQEEPAPAASGVWAFNQRGAASHLHSEFWKLFILHLTPVESCAAWTPPASGLACSSRSMTWYLDKGCGWIFLFLRWPNFQWICKSGPFLFCNPYSRVTWVFSWFLNCGNEEFNFQGHHSFVGIVLQ